MLLKRPKNRSLCIITDNEASLKVSKRSKNWPDKWWRSIEYAPILRIIVSIIRQRDSNGVVTNWEHVYSHLTLFAVTHLKSGRKIDIMYRRFGAMTPQMIAGNHKAGPTCSTGSYRTAVCDEFLAVAQTVQIRPRHE